MVRLQLPPLPTGTTPTDFLSIPLWCDCNLSSPGGAPAPPPTFQSHYGAIATNYLLFPELPDFLSIPLWCDCNRQCTPPVFVWIAAFNPTMVRLQLADVYHIATSQVAFQSHYGAIATYVAHKVK